MNSKGEKPAILVKFSNHKAQTNLFKKRASLKHKMLSDLHPDSSAARCVRNQNLTSLSRGVVKKVSEKMSRIDSKRMDT